uniref:Neur_chan_LBD domain-containing protein n=1 Tax=Heterorhabditis bacteriophora TaxID=37862 RepID=A0A1I7WU50_HETBA
MKFLHIFSFNPKQLYHYCGKTSDKSQRKRKESYEYTKKESFADNDTSVILRDIFSSYDKRVIPFTDGPVIINMTIVLGILIELVCYYYYYYYY